MNIYQRRFDSSYSDNLAHETHFDERVLQEMGRALRKAYDPLLDEPLPPQLDDMVRELSRREQD